LRELRRDLKLHGPRQDPKPATGDGASGFWTALRKGFATSQEHHCRVHKTVNVMRAMPKSVQAKAKGHLHDIRQARTKTTANAAVNVVAEICGVTRDKAVGSALPGCFSRASGTAPSRRFSRASPRSQSGPSSCPQDPMPAPEGYDAKHRTASHSTKARPNLGAVTDRSPTCG
jgi:hypothetical protein